MRKGHIVTSCGCLLVWSLCSTSSFACSRPGTPNILHSHWSSPYTVEVEVQNKSQSSEGSLYYEFSIDATYGDRQRIESPSFDQIRTITLDTHRYNPGRVFRRFQMQLWARRVNNDCRSGGTA